MPADPVLVRSDAEVRDIVRKLIDSSRKNIAVDTEFDTYTPEYAARMAEGTQRKPRVFDHSPATTVGMSLCASHHEAYYIPLRSIYGADAAAIGKRIVASLGEKHGKTLWAWNWKAEWKSLGINPDETQAKYYDAMVLAWLLEAGSPFYEAGKLRYKYGLKDVALHILEYEMVEFSELVNGKELVSGVTEEQNNALYEQEIRDIHAKFAPKPPTKKALNEARKAYNRRAKENVYRKRMVGDLQPESVYKYACADAWATYALASRLVEKAKQEGMWDVFRSVEVPTTRIVYGMERRGIAVDVPYFLGEKKRLWHRVLELEEEWRALADCDIRSASQCADALYNKLKCWPETPSSRTAKGNLAVNKRALAVALDMCEEGSLGRRLALIKQEHSKLFKLVTAYMSEFVFQGQYTSDKRVHAKTMQIGTNTGRFAMKNPNLQSTPKERIRKGIIAPEGRVFCCGDWSSLEIVVMGHFSKDAKIAEIVLSGKSQHDITAEGVGVERSVAKCLHPDTLVFHGGAWARLGSLFTNKEGWQGGNGVVRTYAGDVAVLDRHFGAPKEMFHVVTRNGIVTASADHKFPTARGDLPVRELVKGDIIAFEDSPPRSSNHTQYVEYNRTEHLCMSPALAYVAGAFLGDGCVTHGSVWICGGYKNDEYREWLVELEKAVIECGWAPKVTYIRQNTMFNCAIGDGPHYGKSRIFRALGLIQDVAGKSQPQRALRVPTWVLNGSMEQQLSFLAGLTDTDGHVGKKCGRVAITTKDATFAGDLVVLARVLGFSATIDPGWNKKYNKYYYRVLFSKEINDHLKPYLRYKKKREALTPRMQVPVRRPNQILCVVPAGEFAGYDIMVDNEKHEFYANGVATKNCLNFGLNYGGGATTIARALNVPLEPLRLRSGETVMVAPAHIREWVKKYAETYEGVMAWRAKVAQECARTGYVQTLSGRKRHLPGIYSSDRGEKAGAERQAYNTPIQGTAAEIAKASMVALDAWLKANTPSAFMVLQVHDELVVECDESDGPRIKKAMEDIMANTIKLDLPLKAEVKLGKSWEEAK